MFTIVMFTIVVLESNAVRKFWSCSVNCIELHIWAFRLDDIKTVRIEEQ